MNLTYLDRSKVVVCCGNVLRGDDGFGSFFSDKYSDVLQCIDAGGGAETVLHTIKNTENTISQLIIVDAGDFNGTPGEIKVITRDDLMRTKGFKDLPANMMISAVLIQVKDTRVNYGLSPELEEKLPVVYDVVINLLEGIP